jgi:mono/diheme cytochrome c family protein
MLAAAVTACSGGRTADGAASRTPENPLLSMQPAAARGDPRAQIFLGKGCPQCHQISALQVVSPTNVGPDLTTAVTDVRQRFNMALEDFLRSPTGTMQIVLSSQIRLSQAERDSIAGLLQLLNPSQ